MMERMGEMIGMLDGRASQEGRIALGMSGGVDSSVAAVLLQRAGYEVVGVTCVFHDDVASRHDVAAVEEVCRSLGIDHAVADCTAQFEERVVRPFVAAYAAGLTPSPCVGCNVSCKLPALLEVADQLGCGKVATGHYARIAQLVDNGRYVVKTGLDERKDQSYMLALLEQEQLSRLVLPLGALTKTDARLIARDCGLSVADAPESQDVCFISGDYRDFLRSRGIDDEPGPIVDTAGRVLGEHAGLAGFTVGQRRGIGVAGPEPYYVVGKRIATRELVVGTAAEARIGAALVGSVVWQAFGQPPVERECAVKLRYRSRGAACIIRPADGVSAWTAPRDAGDVEVLLRSAQPATAPGQYAVFYEGSTVLGGGMIKEVMQA